MTAASTKRHPIAPPELHSPVAGVRPVTVFPEKTQSVTVNPWRRLFVSVPAAQTPAPSSFTRRFSEISRPRRVTLSAVTVIAGAVCEVLVMSGLAGDPSQRVMRTFGVSMVMPPSQIYPSTPQMRMVSPPLRAGMSRRLVTLAYSPPATGETFQVAAPAPAGMRRSPAIRQNTIHGAGYSCI